MYHGCDEIKEQLLSSSHASKHLPYQCLIIPESLLCECAMVVVRLRNNYCQVPMPRNIYLTSALLYQKVYFVNVPWL